MDKLASVQAKEIWRMDALSALQIQRAQQGNVLMCTTVCSSTTRISGEG
jgi:hypothetical protein